MGKQNESTFRYFAQFWSEERKMTGFLAALIFGTLIVYPLVSAVSAALMKLPGLMLRKAIIIL